jgi:Phospholipase_D-nuclease N-terminal
MLLATLIGVILLLIAVLAIIDAIRRPDLGGGAKVAWSLFILIVPLIGAIVYLIARPAQPSDRFVPGETEEGVEPWRHGPA